MRRYLAVFAIVMLAAMAIVSQAAAEGQGQRSSTVRYTFPANDVVYPEGIAYHAGNGDFFVGSSANGAVYRGNVRRGNRSLQVFLPAGSDGRTAALGMKVDPKGRLWIAGGGTGTIWMYDAVTGRLLSAFKNGVGGGFVNDVAFGPDGAAYFTDSLVPLMYRIAPDAQGIFRFEYWLDLRGTPIEYTQGFNLNGIAATPDGKYLVVIQTNTGKLFRITIATKEIKEISLAGGDRMMTGDGILLDGNTLHVMRNSLNLIVQIKLAPDFASGQQVGSFTDSSFDFTTAAAKVGDRLLVVNSEFNRRNNPNQPPILPFTISSVRLPE
jgi:Cu-Zn family superoxide dismutase